MLKRCQGAGTLRGSPDPILLHAFRCQESVRELHARKGEFWIIGVVNKLGPLARAMSYLVGTNQHPGQAILMRNFRQLEGSTSQCYNYLHGIATGAAETGGKKPSNAHAALEKDPGFKALMKVFDAQKAQGFSLHPKMEKLRTLLVQYFAKGMLDREEARAPGAQPASEADDSRVMVFVSFRECVDEVVEMLNKENPLIRATRFIGQGTDKHGRKGIAQKEQLEAS